MINAGDELHGAGNLAQAVRTAMINKGVGGKGLISGRKAFQQSMADGVAQLHAIQNVLLLPKV